MVSPLLLTFIAASTTILGGLFSIFFKRDNSKILSLCLSFSAGVMIYLSFMEIFPKGLKHLTASGHSSFWGILSFFTGILLIVFIDKFTPRLSHHEHSDNCDHNHPKIERLGLITMALITLHNFPEGMAVYSVAADAQSFSWPLILAIAIHNIPEGIVIAAPIYFATGNSKKALAYATLSALAEPLGGYLGYSLFKMVFEGLTLGIVFSFVAGIMIFLSIDQLLPEARRNGDHHLVAYGSLAGMFFMALSIFLLS